MPSFGERLRQLRIEKNLTQEELANYFGLHKTRISQYELNKRQADDEMKKKYKDDKPKGEFKPYKKSKKR